MRFSVVPTVTIAVADNFLCVNELSKCPISKIV